jgi:RNA polymerase sigma-70 factor (ECF subfamily)
MLFRASQELGHPNTPGHRAFRPKNSPMRMEIIEAVEELRENRADSVEKALLQLQGVVFSFSMKVCGNREDAEDTMQETLLQAASQLSHFDRPEALSLWLYKVAKTRCLMRRRRSKCAPAHHLSLESLLQAYRGSPALSTRPESTPEELALRGERRELLRQAVLKLPPRYRVPLVLHDMEDLSTRETAAVMGIQEGTVRVRLHRARLFLRRELEGGSPWHREVHQASQALPHRCKTLIAALSEYLDERLDDSLCGELEKHLDRCPTCRNLLSGLKRTVERCRRHRSGERPKPSAQARQALLALYQRARDSVRSRDG